MENSKGSSARSNGRSGSDQSSPQSDGSSRKQISDSSTADEDVEMGQPKAENENPPQDASSQSREVKKEPTDDKAKDTRKVALMAAVAVVILLGLIVGLSVGLTQRNKRNNNQSPNNTVDPPSDFSTVGEGTGVGSLSTPTMYSAPVTDLDDGLLPWRIQSFGLNVIEGYQGCDDLRADLAEAGAYLANVVIRRNSRYGPSYGGGYEMEEEAMDDLDMGIAAEAPMASEMVGDSSAAKESAREPEFEADEAADGGGDAEGETDYGTNNQVEGVDEADVVKSDGTYVFAAYGNKVIQFDTFGRKISETTMPEPQFDEEGCKDHYIDDGHYEEIAEVEELVDFDGRSRRRKLGDIKSKKVRSALHKRYNAQNRRTDSRRRRTSMIADPYWGCWRPEARIESMLLEGNRLVVVVSGYDNYRFDPTTQGQQPILGDVGTTNVRVYDTNSLIPNEVPLDSTEQEPGHPSQLQLVASRDLPGYYANKGGRSIGNRAYLVSNNYVDTWHHFERHFDRWQVIYDSLSDEEYIEAATAYANDKVIPNFTNRLLSELMERADEDLLGTCSHVQQLSLYQTGDIDAAANHWWDSGVFSGLAQITSFDLDQAPIAAASADAEPMLQVQKSVAFVPSSWSTTIYATQDNLFIASQGYDEHPLSRSGYIPTTFILGFDLGDGPARGAKVGKVPGTVLNQFSIDMYEGHLRVATTTWSDWVCPNELTVEEVNEVADEVDVSDADLIEESATIMTTEELPFDDGIFCRGDRFRGPQNQISVLEVEGDADVMVQKGQLGGLGKPGESIYAVRYIDWKAFVVTFERTDVSVMTIWYIFLPLSIRRTYEQGLRSTPSFFSSFLLFPYVCSPSTLLICRCLLPPKSLEN